MNFLQRYRASRIAVAAAAATDSSGFGHPLGEQSAPDRNRLQPVHTGENRFLIQGHVPTRRWVPAEEHAAAILDFLQGPGGRTGTIALTELKQIHAEVCLELDIDPIGWTAVGRELRRLLKDNKTYDYDQLGRRVRVYRIPPARHTCPIITVPFRMPFQRAT
jgi:hypothetical protein